MEKTIRADFGSRPQSRENGILGYIGKLVDHYLYPEISSTDYRMAEYIPPKAEAKRS